MGRAKLSPEAFGTLLAMKRIGSIQFFEASVAQELTGRGLARADGKALTITKAGKAARRQMTATRKKAIRKNKPA